MAQVNTMEEIRQKIRSYIEENFFSEGDDSFTGETPLLSSGIIDSISALEVVDFLEESFSFEVQPHEVDQDNLNTLDKMVQFVWKKKNI